MRLPVNDSIRTIDDHFLGIVVRGRRYAFPWDPVRRGAYYTGTVVWLVVFVAALWVGLSVSLYLIAGSIAAAVGVTAGWYQLIDHDRSFGATWAEAKAEIGGPRAPAVETCKVRCRVVPRETRRIR